MDIKKGNNKRCWVKRDHNLIRRLTMEGWAVYYYLLVTTKPRIKQYMGISTSDHSLLAENDTTQFRCCWNNSDLTPRTPLTIPSAACSMFQIPFSTHPIAPSIQHQPPPVHPWYIWDCNFNFMCNHIFHSPSIF